MLDVTSDTLDLMLTSLEQVTQVADALNYLHRMKVVHGDIRLDNILVSSHGDALLSDFGLRKPQLILPFVTVVTQTVIAPSWVEGSPV